MDEHQSHGNEPQSQPKLDQLDQFFILPVAFSPEMTEAEWSHQIRAMFDASRASRDFVDGKISPSDFSDVIRSVGYDPHQIWESWENGLTITEAGHE